MKLFGSSIEAWHAAFATSEGVQDPFTPRITGGTRNGGMRDVREAESGKIRKAILDMDYHLRHFGMLAYGPDSKLQIQSRDKVYNILWDKFLELTPDNKKLSYWNTVRMTILIIAVVEEGRAQANGESALSDASVACRMGIDRSSFSRTWADSYRALVEMFSGTARAALTEIEPLVNQLNARYKQAS